MKNGAHLHIAVFAKTQWVFLHCMGLRETDTCSCPLLCRLDNEKQARKTVERDLIGLKKMIDDTNLNRMQLESQIESVKEELAFLKKDHKDVRAHTHSPAVPGTVLRFTSLWLCL